MLQHLLSAQIPVIQVVNYDLQHSRVILFMINRLLLGLQWYAFNMVEYTSDFNISSILQMFTWAKN